MSNIGKRIQYLMFSPAGMTIYRMVVAEGGKFPELAQAFYAAGPTTAIRTMANWLDQQSQAGKLSVPDPIFAAEQFYALCRTRFGLLRELQLMNEPPPGGIEHVVEQAVRMFLQYYGASRP
jgi:TetR/AcrR family transcriptional repressor of mexJK operon